MNLRLVLTAGTILACFAMLFFFAMISTYRSWLEDALRKRLVADARTVITAAQWLEGNLVISDRLEDARFDTLESDFVALVYDRDEQLLWRSASTGDFFPDYLPEVWSREGRFIRFDTGANQPDYYLYELEFRLGGQSFSVITGDDVEDIDAGVKVYRRQLGVWLTASIVALLLVVTGGLLWALKPLRRFRRQMRAIEKGEMAQLDEDYPVEIQPLARGLNKLLNTERTRQDRFQTDIADLAHGLKTPLAVISDIAGLLHGDERRMLVEQVQHMNQLITYHLQRTRASGGDWPLQALPLAPLLERLCLSLDKIYRHKGVSWHIDVGDISVRMAEGQVLEIFGNLLDNAFRLCVSRVVVKGVVDGEWVRVSVMDDGPGIAKEKVRQLLSRRTRADHRAQGQGIGLLVVMDIIEEAGGGLTVTRATIGGAVFVVNLPLSLLQDERQIERAQAKKVRRNR